MQFNVLSDLHLELFPEMIKIKLPCTAENLILAGDIGNPCEKSYYLFLERCSSVYKRVFVVKGNHECYGMKVAECDTLIEELCSKLEGCYYLNCSHVDVDGVRVVGCTLWSYIDEYSESDIRYGLNDFLKIESWNVSANNWIHHKEAVFIDNQKKECLEKGIEMVVITHHAPVLGSVNPKYNGDPFNPAFQSDLSELMGDPIKLWVYGHTHYSKCRIVKGTFIVSNQVGYKDEGGSKYNDQFICSTNRIG